jgi:glycosyltransferase involved in cell wall biosynthesis
MEPIYSAGGTDMPRRARRTLRVLRYLVGHFRLLRALDANAPDVVHVQWCRAAPLDYWLINQIRRRGIPVVHTVHDVDPLFAFSFQAALARIYGVVDQIIVHTCPNRDRLLALFPALAAKVRVVPHIAVSMPVPPKATRASARLSLGLPPEVPVLLFFGSARPYKGLEILLEAVMLARRTRPDLVLLVAGSMDSAYARRLVQQARDSVDLRIGYVPYDQAWRYHLAADAAVFPYRRVSQSGALITAMGFGLPVIVTDVGGLRETVDGNGWVVPANDVQSLTAAILSAVENEARWGAMGRRSPEIVRERHSPERVAGETLAVYRDAISSVATR